jgi:ABC-type nitrate/sulfonate/bicarbonate transport system substrate-binding protein
MRRAAFLTSAAGFVVAPRIAHAQSATIRAGSAPVESYALMYFAREQGFFKAAGLDVQIQSFSGGGSVLAALAGGSLDVVCANVGALSNAHSRKIPLSVIAPGGGYSASSPTTVLAIAKTSTLGAAKDLHGKTVAVSTLKDLQQASVMRWVDTNGGDGTALRFIEMPVPEMGAALQAGRVDAATLLEPSLTAEREHIKVLTDCYDAIAKQFFITSMPRRTRGCRAIPRRQRPSLPRLGRRRRGRAKTLRRPVRSSARSPRSRRPTSREWHAPRGIRTSIRS